MWASRSAQSWLSEAGGLDIWGLFSRIVSRKLPHEFGSMWTDTWCAGGGTRCFFFFLFSLHCLRSFVWSHLTSLCVFFGANCSRNVHTAANQRFASVFFMVSYMLKQWNDTITNIEEHLAATACFSLLLQNKTWQENYYHWTCIHQMNDYGASLYFSY